MDISALTAALGGIQQIKGVAQAAIGAKQAIDVGRIEAELLPLIVEAYTQLLEARMAQMELGQRLREAEDEKRAAHDELTRQQAWAREAARYRLARVGREAYAYALKPEAAFEEPAHYLCQPCYAEQKKSVLQRQQGPGRYGLVCPRCAAVVLADMAGGDDGGDLCLIAPSGGGRRML